MSSHSTLHQKSSPSTHNRLAFLHPTDPERKVVPSSSTAALGSPEGNVNGLASLVHPAVQQQLIKLHVQDVRAGAGMIVTATCGGHARQARPDPKNWSELPDGKHRDDALFELNQLAVAAAYTARQTLGDDSLPIFGSVITSGDCYDGKRQLRGPLESLTRRYRDDHRSQLEAFSDPQAPVDAVLVEAGGVSIIELLAICELCKDLSLAVLLSLAVDDDGQVLDESWKIPFEELAERAGDILGNGFLGLGLNCNSRNATKRALERDHGQHFRMVYPNKSEASAAERREGNFCKGATPEQEIAFLQDILPVHAYIKALGCCCRDERDAALLGRFLQLLGSFR